MRLAAVGLLCFAAGCGCAWAAAQYVTVSTMLRVVNWNYGGRL